MSKDQEYNNLHDLETKKVAPLVWSYALPSIIGTTVNALYNIIDRVFIGNAPGLGDLGMSALGKILPIMAIIAAFGMLIGIGAASRISLHLGKGDKETAEEIIGNSLLLTLCITLSVTFLLFFFLDEVLVLLNLIGKEYNYGKDFLTFYLPGAIFSTMCFSFNNMMRASGYPRKAMFTMILTVLINILLAPILIFGFDMGMKGAALATVIAMFVGTFFVILHFVNGENNLKLRFKNIKLNRHITYLILSIGMSPFLIQLVASGVIININNRLQFYGGELYGQMNVSAYTIVNALVLLIVMTITGLTQGMQPIVGYNYGAGNMTRVKQVLLYVIKVGVSIGCVGFIIGHFFPFIVVDPFNPSPQLSDVSKTALMYVTTTAPLIGFQVVVSSFFQCIGMVKKSIFLSMTRQLIIFLPSLYILPHLLGVKGVWLSFPVADIGSTMITAIVFYYQMKAFKKNNYINKCR